MTTITAKVIADSVLPGSGSRLTTLQLRYPRWIHAEMRTHRLLRQSEEGPTPSLMEDENLSRNASSSRAVPVAKLIEDVLRDPAVPIFWGKNQKGMQAGGEHNAIVKVAVQYGMDMIPMDLPREEAWRRGLDQAVELAKAFDEAGYHKQLVNRLLEPFSHINTVVTATEWGNFFELRDHPDAEPHLRMLAQAIIGAIAGSNPWVLRRSDWHLPYVDPFEWTETEQLIEMIKASVARCARVSYLTSEGKKPTLSEDVTLYDRLVSSRPLHASPAEHQATSLEGLVYYPGVLEVLGWQPSLQALPLQLSGNFSPEWVQLRKILEKAAKKVRPR